MLCRMRNDLHAKRMKPINTIINKFGKLNLKLVNVIVVK